MVRRIKIMFTKKIEKCIKSPLAYNMVKSIKQTLSLFF